VTDYDANLFVPVDLAQVALDVYTDTYRVSGKAMTRFARVADIANQAANTHLHVEEATISEYADPTATIDAGQVLVNMNAALLVITAESAAPQRPEMRIPKRSVRAQVAVPPFRLTGTVHVPTGSRPADGVLNATDRFLTMTEATIAPSPALSMYDTSSRLSRTPVRPAAVSWFTRASSSVPPGSVSWPERSRIDTPSIVRSVNDMCL